MDSPWVGWMVGRTVWNLAGGMVVELVGRMGCLLAGKTVAAMDVSLAVQTVEM